MKPTKSYQTTLNKINMTLQEYSLLKKYSCGNQSIIFLYQFNQNLEKTVKLGLIAPELKQIYEQENLGGKMTFNQQKMPFKDVELTSFKASPVNDNAKQWKNINAHLVNMINKPIIINLWSDLGEASNKAATYITETLNKKGFKPITTNGVSLNSISVDFDENIGDLLKKDFLTIFGFNAIFATEYRKNYVQNIFALAKLQNKPVILSSNCELKNNEFKVINVKFVDTKQNQQQLIDEIFFQDNKN